MFNDIFAILFTDGADDVTTAFAGRVTDRSSVTVIIRVPATDYERCCEANHIRRALNAVKVQTRSYRKCK